MLLFWGGIVKLPAMLAQFLLVRSAFWLRCNGLVRGLMIYLMDLLVSVMAVALLLQVWINALFIDAGFPVLMILFPYNILTGLLAAMLSPVQQRPEQQDNLDDFTVDPRLLQLVTGLLFFITFIATFLVSTSTASGNFELLGQTKAFFPVFLLVCRLYLFPTFMALNRVPHKTLKKLLINLLLGWTLVGWISCLLWALRSTRTREPEKSPFNWRSPVGWLITAFGMILTGVGISVLGQQMTAISETQSGSIVAPVILLLLSLALTGAGIRILFRINLAPSPIPAT